jgi:sulfur carrier protein
MLTTRDLSTLSVNGRPHAWTGQTLVALLRELGLSPEQPGLAAAVNAELVRREEWAALELAPGDHVEIVQATAGG